MTLDEYDVLGHEVLYACGSFRKDRYWLRGWVQTKQGSVQYIHGYTGKETVLTIERIVPVVTFDVL